MEGYDIYSTDSYSASGGTAIYVNKIFNSFENNKNIMWLFIFSHRRNNSNDFIISWKMLASSKETKKFTYVENLTQFIK